MEEQRRRAGALCIKSQVTCEVEHDELDRGRCQACCTCPCRQNRGRRRKECCLVSLQSLEPSRKLACVPCRKDGTSSLVDLGDKGTGGGK